MWFWIDLFSAVWTGSRRKTFKFSFSTQKKKSNEKATLFDLNATMRTDFQKKPNLLVSNMLFDLLQGMPWHFEMNLTVDYLEHAAIFKLRETHS